MRCSKVGWKCLMAKSSSVTSRCPWTLSHSFLSPFSSSLHPQTQLNLGNTSKSCSRPPTTSVDASHHCRSPSAGLLFDTVHVENHSKTGTIAFARPAGHGISMPHRGCNPRRGSRYSEFRASLKVVQGEVLSPGGSRSLSTSQLGV